ncbi:DUF2848 domain-containing protein [Pseudomonas sp. dw_358]|uniref:DUF2848 domain-containing protein n=1 Tax=Pseudomonas sp. dw_358 TaxID=2720083 RepID=UPI001BD44D6D|nr:DUF2848 domain-containing protein [Pseudomonas sp. dw_358]
MTSKTLSFEVVRKETQPTPTTITFKRLIIAGWTGRDKLLLQHHIDEMRVMGVQAPATTPLYFRVTAPRLTHQQAIESPGTQSSGEVEFVLVKHAGEIFVGVGSDHTDNLFESSGSTIAKQMCEKPMARQLWALSDVEAHWDEIELRAWIEEAGVRTLYQEGKVVEMLHPRDLIDGLFDVDETFEDGTALYGGTFSAIGGIRFATAFEFEINDPVLNRRIGHRYTIDPLPIRG